MNPIRLLIQFKHPVRYRQQTIQLLNLAGAERIDQLRGCITYRIEWDLNAKKGASWAVVAAAKRDGAVFDVEKAPRTRLANLFPFGGKG